MKKNTLYFTHDFGARNDIKLIKLRKHHGWQAYGLYFAIIEMLYESDGYMSIEDIETIAYELHVDDDLIKIIIYDYDLFKIENNMFFSESCLRRLEKINEKREVAIKAAEKRWKQNNDNQNVNANALQTQCERNANAMQMQCDGNARKKERKKERKKDIVNIDTEISKIIDYYNQNRGNCLPVSTVTDARINLVSTLLDIYDAEMIMSGIDKIKNSRYLQGKLDDQANRPSSFDFIFRSDTFVKLLEGTYDEKQRIKKLAI